MYLRGGIYSADLFIAPVNSGEAASPISFSAYNQEQVLVNNQKISNGSHEQAAWASWRGAASEHSTAKVWDGSYSTSFRTTAGNQGIRSAPFSLTRDRSSLGYWWTVRVFSDQVGVNIQLRRDDDSEVLLNKDYSVLPNQWNVIEGYVVPVNSGEFVLVVASPAAAPKGTWHVDGTRMNAYQASVYLNGRDHISVQGIKFESVWRGFELRNGADHNEISRCSFTDMNVYSANLIWDSNGAPSRYNWIHDSVFHDSGSVKRTTSSTRCDDIQTLFRIGNGTTTDSSSFNLVEKNQFYHGGHDLVIIATKFNTFRNNILHNEGWMLNREGPCQDVDGDASTFNNPARFGNRGLLFENPGNNGGQTLVEGNRIGFSGTPPDDDGASGIENPSDGNIVRYNFLFKNGAAGYYFKAQPGISGTDVLPDNNVVYNNTIYQNGGGQDISQGFQSGLFLACGSGYTPPNPVGNVIKNNIVYDNVSNVAKAYCAGYDYVSNFEQDPFFVNPDLTDPFSSSLPNLALRSGSPAIDRGAELTTVRSGDSGTGTTVAVGNARFFQDGSWAPPGKVQPDVIAIGSPTNVAKIVSVDYSSNTLIISGSLARRAGDPIWLSQKSDGATVLAGSRPDFGASEFVGLPQAPSGLRIIR